MINNLFGFTEVGILSLFWVIRHYDVICYCRAFKLAYFVEHNISYQPCKYQLSRMSGSNFTSGGGGGSPVLLELNQ